MGVVCSYYLLLQKKQEMLLNTTATTEMLFFMEQQPDSLNDTGYRLVRKQRLKETIEPISSINPEEIFSSLVQEKNDELILPERNNVRQTADWEIGVFIISLLLLVFVRFFHNSYLQLISEATVNFNTANRMFREKSMSLIQASVQMDILFYIVFSFFVFQLSRFFNVQIYKIPIIEYLIICGIVVGFFIVKKAIYVFQGNICKSYTETKEYLFNINIYNRVLAVILLPIVMTLTFSKLNNIKWLIFLGLFFVTICYFLVIIRGMKILIQKRFSIFYLILYLCTLEILPFLYIYKLVLG